MKLQISKEALLIASGVVLTSSLIWLGFGTAKYEIDICESIVSKYVTADFSELETGIDTEGNFYSEWVYWTEDASEVYTEAVVNELPVYPPMPPHNKDMKRWSDFDRFNFNTSTKLKVGGFNYESRTEFTESISSVQSCLEKLGTYVDVNTWYTITYGSEFK
jgi:hypothetical protein